MTCRHDWEQRSPHVRVCALCDMTEHDPYPPRRISEAQASALGFARNGLLLKAKFWTFPEDAFRRYGT